MSSPLPPEVDRLARDLAEGLDDRQVARKEGVSVRTVRRRSARLMDALDAVTRFQAGFEYGLRWPERRHQEDTSP
jgi:DNA-binding NarL/FixJ family response regulator